MLNAAQQRAEVLALGVLRRGQRKRTHGAAMEAAVERDQLVALGGVTSQLDGALNGFRARVAEEHLPVVRRRHGGYQPFGELRHVVMIKIRAGDVDQFRGLLLNGFYHFRMAVARRADGDTRAEIQERISVRIFHDSAVAALGDKRIVTRERRRNVFCVVGNHFLRLWPRQSGDDSGQFGCFSGRDHNSSRNFVSEGTAWIRNCAESGQISRDEHPA